MSVHTSDMFMGTPTTAVCVCCGKRLSKWIHMMPGGIFCGECAQITMRRLMEDLIEFHNPGKQHISLLDIMYHGDPRKEPGGELNKGDKREWWL